MNEVSIEGGRKATDAGIVSIPRPTLADGTLDPILFYLFSFRSNEGHGLQVDNASRSRDISSSQAFQPRVKLKRQCSHEKA